MASQRVRRGRQTEQLVADFLASHGWPDAARIPASLPGRDILKVPGLSFEVKARRELALPTWLRQTAAASGDDHPILVHRPDGFGEKTVHLWPATMALDCLVELLHEAGYGAKDSDT